MLNDQQSSLLSIFSGSLFGLLQCLDSVINSEISHVFIVGIVGGAGGYIGKFILQKTIFIYHNNKK